MFPTAEDDGTRWQPGARHLEQSIERLNESTSAAVLSQQQFLDQTDSASE